MAHWTDGRCEWSRTGPIGRGRPKPTGPDGGASMPSGSISAGRASHEASRDDSAAPAPQRSSSCGSRVAHSAGSLLWCRIRVEPCPAPCPVLPDSPGACADFVRARGRLEPRLGRGVATLAAGIERLHDADASLVDLRAAAPRRARRRTARPNPSRSLP
jgi:hypothetical protein